MGNRYQHGADKMTTELKPKHLKALKRAIDEAECWRGSLVGNPDPADLNEFDRFITTAKAALLIVRQQNKAAKSINKGLVT